MKKTAIALGIVFGVAFAIAASPFNVDIWRDCRSDDGRWFASYLFWSSRMAPGHWGFSGDGCHKFPHR